MPSGKSNSRLKKIAILSSLPALLAASYFYYPQVHDGVPVCYFKLVAGIPCPGCGLTRAFCHMTHLDFSGAMRHHLIGPPLLLYLALWYGLEVRRLSRPSPMPVWWGGAGRAILLACFLLYCGRMVTFFSHPQGFLSPLKYNMIARIVRLDFSNTYEPW